MTYLFKALEPNFLSQLDSNPYLLAFKNGVYDLQTHTLRQGDKSDYITYSTKYDYTQYDNDSSDIKDIYEFLQKIIPNVNVLDYLLKVLGRSLLGINDERFYIFTGLSGANGKSTLINFLEYTLGDYAIGVDVSLLTNKRGLSSNASPDVMRIKGRRLVTFQEPEANDVLKTGIIKAFSGGDTIVARDLFKSPISFKIQATMLMCCNDIPAINSVDGGTFRRLRVIDYTSRFCDNPSKPNEFMIDPAIKSKIIQWKPYFMSMLLHYYKKYDEEVKIYGKIKEPIEVLASTNKYKAENDLFDEYLMECIETDEHSFESNTSIYNHFNTWWVQNYSRNKIPSPKELKKSMKIKYGDEIENMKKLGFKVRIKDIETDHIKDDY
jgi:P4 family phage/plasmid primase-like protien